MKTNRNHPLMFKLMLLRNKQGTGTKLDEGYISNPDWVCLAIHLCPGLTAKEIKILGKEWRNNESLASVVCSADRCHADNYEGTETHGKAPNIRTQTPLYFYNDPKRQKGKAKQYFLTRLGEERAKELEKLVPNAYVDFEGPHGWHARIWLPGSEYKINNDCHVMTHFRKHPYGDLLEVDSYINMWGEKPRFGEIVETLTKGTTIKILQNIRSEVFFIRTPSGKEGFIGELWLSHPFDTQKSEIDNET